MFYIYGTPSNMIMFRNRYFIYKIWITHHRQWSMQLKLMSSLNAVQFSLKKLGACFRLMYAYTWLPPPAPFSSECSYRKILSSEKWPCVHQLVCTSETINLTLSFKLGFGIDHFRWNGELKTFVCYDSLWNNWPLKSNEVNVFCKAKMYCLLKESTVMKMLLTTL